MKTLTFFYLPGCPYCRKARRLMSDLFLKHPEYRNVPIREIDESAQPEVADSYPYYYVPCFFMEGKNLFEGDPSKEDIEAVFKAAYEAASI